MASRGRQRRVYLGDRPVRSDCRDGDSTKEFLAGRNWYVGQRRRGEGSGIWEKGAWEMVQYEDPRTGKLPADLKEKLTSECWANLERWSVQLKKNLSDPAFKKQLLDVMR